MIIDVIPSGGRFRSCILSMLSVFSRMLSSVRLHYPWSMQPNPRVVINIRWNLSAVRFLLFVRCANYLPHYGTLFLWFLAADGFDPALLLPRPSAFLVQCFSVCSYRLHRTYKVIAAYTISKGHIYICIFSCWSPCVGIDNFYACIYTYIFTYFQMNAHARTLQALIAAVHASRIEVWSIPATFPAGAWLYIFSHCLALSSVWYYCYYTTTGYVQTCMYCSMFYSIASMFWLVTANHIL
jgi:hypothetical protein